METLNITTQTKQMIDSLKAVCSNYGLGNASSEYKIITEVFLYKFLNDKFLYEVKTVNNNFKGLSTAEVEEKLAKMKDEDYEMMLLDFGADTATLKKEHLISYLFNHKNISETSVNGKRYNGFHELFDETLKNISKQNMDIFAVRTGGESKMNLFSGISQHVLEQERKDDFCRAIIDKIADKSFESMFTEKYDFFATIFEYLIKDYNKDFGKYAEYYTPHSIATIIAKILVPDPVSNVQIYDPAAGSGTLILALAHQIGENNCTIYTQDISQKSNEFCRLNLILNNLVHSLPNIIHGDTLLHPYHKENNGAEIKKFDYVISNPPFNTDFSDNRDILASDNYKNRFFAGVPNIPEKDKDTMPTYLMFLQHIICSLKPNGKAAVVVPTGFLTKGKGIDLKIKRYLIDKKILQGVVSLPKDIFSTTGTKVSVLFLENNNINKEVFFIDASNMGSKDEEAIRNQRIILSKKEEDKIVFTYINKNLENKFSTQATFEKIRNNEYRISPSNYFQYEMKYNKIDSCSSQQYFMDKIKRLKLYYSKDLEKLVSDIFNYWFVQFNFPNSNGLPYYDNGGKLYYNEKIDRNIPIGWQVKSILEVAKVIDCLHSKKPDYKYESEEYFLLQPENLTDDGRIDVSSKYYISKHDYIKWSSKIEIQKYDFIMTNAGRTGAIGMVGEDIKCVLGRNMTSIRADKIDPLFLRQFLLSPYMQKYLASNLDEGAFFKSFNVKSIKKINVIIPPNDVMVNFLSLTKGLILRLINGVMPQEEKDYILSLFSKTNLGK